MITRRHRQRNIFEAVIGPLEKLVEGLTEPALERFDQVLTDEQLLEAVVVRLAERRPHSRNQGRPGTPAEVALRMLVLKRLRGWSFDETEREVRASLVYRKLARVYFEKVPDAKTLIRLSAVIGAEGVEAIHHRLVEIAQQQKLVTGRRARVDTTVVETGIRYPTDSRLLADGVRVLTRALKRIEQAAGVLGAKLRERMRATTHRVLEISRVRRAAAQTKLGSGLNEDTADSWPRCAARCAMRSGSPQSSCQEPAWWPANALLLMVVGAQAQLERFLPLVRRVIAQTRARVFGGDTHYRDKLFSLFEPHTEAIRKGKASKPTEFGKLVKIQEAENQIVVTYAVYEKRVDDRSLLLPAIAAHHEIFGRVPELVAADRGFWSQDNKRRARQAGVKKVCIPAQGRLSEEDRVEQRQPWFRRGQRYRTGCEGRISVLKRRDGLSRCPYHRMHGIRRWVGWSVVSNNLWVLISDRARA